MLIYDYIVVGGGLAGSVISNRLFGSDDSLRILLLEAGVDASHNTLIPYANYSAIGSDLDWKYNSQPQPNLNGRTLDQPAGKCLGGGTALNSCGWFRGQSNDFDLWAETVDDDRYSYNGQLPYFKKTETYFSKSWNPTQHGFTGPLTIASTTSTGMKFPLREPIADAWSQVGVKALPYLDGNGGNNQGRAELTQDRKAGLRQLASSAYPLGGITTLTSTLVESVLTSKIGGKVTATGILLANGTKFYGKEVIVSAGTYRSPQVLMLSGIGPSAVLKMTGVTPAVNLPAVGQNLFDHLEYQFFWKLKNASAGYAIGSNNPIFAEPAYGNGLPIDWAVTHTVPKDGLISAITKDEKRVPTSAHVLLSKTRSFIEHFVIYAAGSAANPVVQTNGSHIMSTMVHFMPTSRGTVTINSTDPNHQPVIDPKYMSTEVDKYAFRTGIRKITSVMLGTTAGKAIIASETPPDSFAPLNLDVTDAYLDARIKSGAYSTYHPMGTCSMGKVVDTDFRVKGVNHLRVVDASVIPNPISAHIQAAVYALAEQAAAILIEENSTS